MTRIHTASGKLVSRTLKLTEPMNVFTLSWVGLAILTTGLLMTSLLRLELGEPLKGEPLGELPGRLISYRTS